MLGERVGPVSNAALQLKTAFEYDGFGNVTAVEQNDGNDAGAKRRLQIGYDAQGHLPTSQIWVIDGQSNLTVSRVWDYRLTEETQVTGVDGLKTLWRYDAFGRLTLEDRPDGTSSTVGYQSCGTCFPGNASYKIQTAHSDGSWVRSFHDSFGRGVAAANVLTDGRESRQVVEYDNQGRIDRANVPYVNGDPSYWVNYTYDLLGRRTQENRPTSEAQTSGTLTTVSYQGLTTEITDPNSHKTTYQSDTLGRMDQVTDPAGGVTQYEYTAFGELDKVADPASNATTMVYNARGRKTSMTDPDMGNWIYSYNVFGELVSQTDAKNQTVTFNYDQLGRLESRVEPEGTTSWTFLESGAAKGRIDKVTSPGGFQEQYVYDSLGRTEEIQTTIDAVVYFTNAAYDPQGRLSRLIYPASAASERFDVSYQYDSYGYLSRVVNGANSAEVFYEVGETDAFGREMAATLGNGITELRTYDRANGRLSKIEAGPNISSTVQDLSYEWDKVGNLLKREDLNQNVDEVLTYDNLYRLKTAARNGTSTLTVAYDSIGNITSKSDVGTYTYGAGSAGPHAVTNITGMGTFSYDINGNMTSRAGDSITWTSYNKPKKIDYGNDSAEFTYGPDRARFKQVANTGTSTVTTYYVGAHFEEEVQGSLTTYRHHIMAGGQAVAIHTNKSDSTEHTRYVHRDHLGSVVALTDGTNGSVVEQYSFDAFGKRRNVDWTADNSDSLFGAGQQTERGYTGHEHLDNVRLVHMNGRVQDPVTGRFLSADPIVQAPFSSQSLNRYSYVGNNPLSFVDPSGFSRIRSVADDPFGGYTFQPTPMFFVPFFFISPRPIVPHRPDIVWPGRSSSTPATPQTPTTPQTPAPNATQPQGPRLRLVPVFITPDDERSDSVQVISREELLQLPTEGGILGGGLITSGIANGTGPGFPPEGAINSKADKLPRPLRPFLQIGKSPLATTIRNSVLTLGSLAGDYAARFIENRTVRGIAELGTGLFSVGAGISNGLVGGALVIGGAVGIAAPEPAATKAAGVAAVGFGIALLTQVSVNFDIARRNFTNAFEDLEAPVVELPEFLQ